MTSVEHAVTMTISGSVATVNNLRRRYEPLVFVGTGETFKEAVYEVQAKLNMLINVEQEPKLIEGKFGIVEPRTLTSDIQEDR